MCLTGRMAISKLRLLRTSSGSEPLAICRCRHRCNFSRYRSPWGFSDADSFRKFLREQLLQVHIPKLIPKISPTFPNCVFLQSLRENGELQQNMAVDHQKNKKDQKGQRELRVWCTLKSDTSSKQFTTSSDSGTASRLLNTTWSSSGGNLQTWLLQTVGCSFMDSLMDWALLSTWASSC